MVLEQAHYKLNETSGTTVIDSSGNGNTGTNNGATVNQAGKIDKAYDFNGSSDDISVSDNSSLDITNNMSISVWIKLDSLGSNQGFVSKCGYGVANFNYAFMISSNDKLRWLDTDDTTDTTNDYISIGTWYHVVVTYESGSVKFYVDNDLKETKSSGASTLTPNNYDLLIGEVYTYSQNFNGLIDDVRIYDFVLTTTDIGLIYNSGNGTETDLATLRGTGGTTHNSIMFGSNF